MTVKVNDSCIACGACESICDAVFSIEDKAVVNEAAVADNNAEEAKALFVKATKSLDMAAQKGVVHQNMAARKKSRLAAKLNAMA